MIVPPGGSIEEARLLASADDFLLLGRFLSFLLWGSLFRLDFCFFSRCGFLHWRVFDLFGLSLNDWFALNRSFFFWSFLFNVGDFHGFFLQLSFLRQSLGLILQRRLGWFPQFPLVELLQ